MQRRRMQVPRQVRAAQVYGLDTNGVPIKSMKDDATGGRSCSGRTTPLPRSRCASVRIVCLSVQILVYPSIERDDQPPNSIGGSSPTHAPSPQHLHLLHALVKPAHLKRAHPYIDTHTTRTRAQNRLATYHKRLRRSLTAWPKNTNVVVSVSANHLPRMSGLRSSASFKLSAMALRHRVG